MLQSFETLLPVFAIIVLGIVLRRKLVTDPALWYGAERLAFWVLFPFLLTKTLINADLKTGQTGSLVTMLIIAVIGYSLFVLVLKPILLRSFGMTVQTYSTIYQVSTRWNGFIALAIVEKLYGEQGISLVAVAFAAMVPILNLQNVTIVSWLLSEQRPTAWRLMK